MMWKTWKKNNNIILYFTLLVLIILQLQSSHYNEYNNTNFNKNTNMRYVLERNFIFTLNELQREGVCAKTRMEKKKKKKCRRLV